MARTKSAPMSNNNFIILMALGTLLALGVTVIASRAMIMTVIRDTKILGMKNTASNRLSDNLKTAPKLVQAYGDLSVRGLVSDALPVTADFPSLIAMSENIAKKSGVTLKSISQDSTSAAKTSTLTSSNPSAAVPPPAPSVVPYQVSVQGSYDSFQKLLDALEHSARPIRIGSLQVAGTGSDLTVNMVAETYYQDKATIPYKTELVK